MHRVFTKSNKAPNGALAKPAQTLLPDQLALFARVAEIAKNTHAESDRSHVASVIERVNTALNNAFVVGKDRLG